MLGQARDLFASASGREGPDTLDAMSKLAAAYHDCGRYDEAAALKEEILKVRKAKLGAEHPDTLAAMFSLSRDYFYNGKGQEIPLIEEAYRLQKAKLGLENPDTLRSMAELGDIYAMHDRAAEGLPLMEQALKLQKIKLAPDHQDTLRTTLFLANALNCLGRRAEAISLFQELVKVQKVKLGPAHPETNRSMGILVEAYLASGQTDEAIRLFDEMREFMKTMPGEDTAEVQDDVALAYGRIGEVLMHQDRTVEAAAEFARALDLASFESSRQTICRQLAHSEEVFDRVAKLRPMETTLWTSRGQNRALRDEWTAAAADYAKVINRRGVDDQSFEYAGLLLLNGDTHAYQQFCIKLAGPPAKAHGDWQRFNLARTCALGPAIGVDAATIVEWATPAMDDGLTNSASVQHALGLACCRAGQLDAAIDHIQKSNAAGWGATPNEALNYLVLAMIHYRSADIAEARRCYRQAREIIEASKPASTSDARMISSDWIESNVLLQEMEPRLKPIDLDEEAIKRREANTGTENLDTLDSTFILANAYKDAGRIGKALPLFEETVRLSKATLGPTDTFTLHSMVNLAVVYLEAGQIRRATSPVSACPTARIARAITELVRDTEADLAVPPHPPRLFLGRIDRPASRPGVRSRSFSTPARCSTTWD